MNNNYPSGSRRGFVRAPWHRRAANCSWVWPRGLVIAFLCFAICIFGASGRAGAGDRDEIGKGGDEAPDRSKIQQEIETVLLAIESNNQKLGALDLILRVVSEDRTVDHTESHRQRTASGGVWTVTKSPRTELFKRVVIDGRKLRFDDLTKGRLITKSIVFDGSQWHEYDPKRKIETVRRPEQMAKSFPIDPREALSYDSQSPMQKLLQRGAFAVDAGHSTVGERRGAAGTSGALLLNVPTDSAQRFEVQFDTAFDLLPVESTVYHPDGTVFKRTTVVYRRLEARNAWVPERFTSKFYPIGATKAADAPGFTQITTTYVEEVQLLDESDAARALSESLPATKRITDLSRPVKTGSQVGLDLARLFMVLFNVILLIAAMFFALRLFRRRSRRLGRG